MINRLKNSWTYATPLLTSVALSACTSAYVVNSEISQKPSYEVPIVSVSKAVETGEKPRSLANDISDLSAFNPSDQVRSLDQYILLALEESSELKSAFEGYKAALEKSPQVSTLPDPTLNYGYFLKEVETRVGPQDQRVGVMQPIPWFGKLSLKGEIADSEAQAAYYAFLSRKNKLVANVTSAFLELAYLEQATDITEANLELLKRWEQVLSQRYRSQSGTQANLIKVQVELGTLEDKLRELRDLRAPLASRLNSLLNRSSGEQIEITESALEKATPLVTSIELEQAALEARLDSANPDLLFLEALHEAKERGVLLAHKNFYPDFGVGADYVFVGDRDMAGSESGDDALVAMFSVTLPLYRTKYEAGLSQAKKERRSIEEQKKAKSFELTSALAKSLFDVKDSSRKIELYKHTLVPKAEESLESNYTAFEAGESSFLDLLDAERIYLQFKLALAREQADFQIANANLRALLGDYSPLGEDVLAKGVR